MLYTDCTSRFTRSTSIITVLYVSYLLSGFCILYMYRCTCKRIRVSASFSKFLIARVRVSCERTSFLNILWAYKCNCWRTYLYSVEEQAFSRSSPPPIADFNSWLLFVLVAIKLFVRLPHSLDREINGHINPTPPIACVEKQYASCFICIFMRCARHSFPTLPWCESSSRPLLVRYAIRLWRKHLSLNTESHALGLQFNCIGSFPLANPSDFTLTTIRDHSHRWPLERVQ